MRLLIPTQAKRRLEWATTDCHYQGLEVVGWFLTQQGEEFVAGFLLAEDAEHG